MAHTYRDHPDPKKRKGPPKKKLEKPEPKEIWVGDTAVIEKHFLHLTRLLRDEERSERDRYKSDFLEKKPEDRERGGKAIYRLDLLEVHYNPSGQKLLTFALKTKRPLPRYSLGTGDIVRLSGFRTPEAECPMGAVYERDRMRITVAFNGRLPPWIDREDSFQLAAAENLSTFERMHEAIRLVKEADHSRIAVFRDISLGLRKPKLDDPVPVSGFPFLDLTLNETQKKAVCMASEARDILLIHGPPGTGKTRVLIEIIRQAVSRGETVLVSAPSNAACDNLVEGLAFYQTPVTRLGQPARVSERIREHTFSYKLAAHPYAKMIGENEARLEQLSRQKERRQIRRTYEWEERKEMRAEIERLRIDIKDLRSRIFKQVWNASDIVVATHVGAADPLIKAKKFDWVIIDEATQGVEPSTWIPLCRAGKVIMAGDHCQLPPTVQSPRQGKDSLRFTLFERLHEKLGHASKVRLERQYRMHEAIMDFPSREFYEKRLIADESVKRHKLTDLPFVKDETLNDPSAMFLDTAGLGYEEEAEEGTGSHANPEEARLVVKTLGTILAAGVRPRDIAVISPYSAQVKLLTDLIVGDNRDPGEMGELEIDSVDAFQGREKEVVLVSLVRSNPEGEIGFLADTRRMNVAMTRAKRKLILVGDSATLCRLPFYDNLLKYTESVGGYRSAWE
ncbi:MAG: ATP-dependent RecD-like DNA helicase [Candidatus Omnitrophica bacterium ADurb.Bin277]|nr:MAG: ATP-dependent RecD-like DNA helicase [Candidatus Omnitrophica bacterium ADurb.Bin277]